MDSEQRLCDIERKIKSIDVSIFSSSKIDFIGVWSILWKGKWVVVGATFLLAVIGAAYSFTLPDIYRSTGVYAPVPKKNSGGMVGDFGGIAAIAGIGFGGNKSNDIDQAMLLITSWPFLESVIDKYDLKPLIVAVKGWDSENDKLIWNEDLYDPVNRSWLYSAESKLGTFEPSSSESYNALKSRISLDKDSKTSLITLSIEYFSPEISALWLRLIIDEINTYFQERDISEARESIEYLEKQISKTSISEMKSVFYSMVETQTKTLMLAEVRSQYLLHTVIEPKPAENKSKPRRFFLILLSAFFGFCMSFIFLMASHIWKEKSE